MIERRIDVRGLPPPEPLERILDSVQALEQGEVLVVAIHRRPFPLYPLLARLGLTAETLALPDSTFEVRITRGA